MPKIFKARQAFQEEAREELLPELETSLLELGENPGDPELIHQTFRVLHTLKGSGAMFGFDRLSELAHEMETVFDDIRNGHSRVNTSLVELALSAKDVIQLLVDDSPAVDETVINDLAEAFRQLATGASPDDHTPEAAAAAGDEVAAWNAYHIRFQPEAGIFATGNNPLLLLDELRELGSTRMIAHIDRLPLLETMHPEECYTWWDILLATDQPRQTIRDVFIFVEEVCRLDIVLLADKLQTGQEETAFDRMEQALSENPDGDLTPFFSMFTETSPEQPDFANQTQDRQTDQPTAARSPEQRQARQGTRTISSMRVQAAKLDQLVNLVGELVIAQTRLSRLADQQDDPTLLEIAETVERLTSDLRDNTLDIRMMPIGSSFGKFKRVVWDFSSQTGKAVELITEGAATELDKTVIERLDDPLVHLLRNSIDHGIEDPEERQTAGKPRQGKIVFSAEHSGGNVIITITDDGRGIDPEAVRVRAVETGLLAPDAAPGEQELLNLIFEPGFSTSRQVSELSGRGVGMDVVKQNILALRGRVRINSKKGRGTTVRMTLPLTLAIIDGLRVKIGEDFFIIPLSAVSECLELAHHEMSGNRRQRFIDLRNQLVPFLSLRDWFAIPGLPPEGEQVVIVMAEKKLVGLIVDEVIDLQQTVIKSLGEAHKDIPGLSGATIQGDGSLALILDVDPLVHKAQETLAAETP